MCDEDHLRGSPECPASRIGKRVAGKYDLKSLIGVGGMGAVYRATHLALGVEVAIKMIHMRFSARQELARRFEDEARRVATLRHPGIVQVSDLGRDNDGCPYIEMEILSGRPVDELVRAGPLPLDRALDIVCQALEALEYAHERGIVHRDLKPENLFLVGDRQVKILDFGIAKAMAEAGDSVTQTGTMMGTPTYMSPEQLTDTKRVDRRTDIYAMGATLFELLTAQRSVSGTTLAEVISNVLQGKVLNKPSLQRGQLPPWLDTIVETSLATDPGQRFQTAAAMKRAIEVGRAAGASAPTSVAAGAPASVHQGPAAVAAAPTIAYVPSKRRIARVAIPSILVAVAAVTIVVMMRGDEKPATVGTAENATPAADAATPAADAARAELPDASLALPPSVPDDMIRIAGGTFEMGSTKDETDEALRWCEQLAGQPCPRELYERELPRHPVTIAPFLIDRTEVTNAAYAAALTAGQVDSHPRFARIADVLLADLDSKHSGVRSSSAGFVSVEGKEELPAVQITWEGAEWYCASIGKRLPFEAEWELASRGLQRRAFPWGSDREISCDDVTYGRGIGKPCARGGDRPAAVGSAKRDRTPEGVHDLGGNVAEWVFDAFAPYDATCTGTCAVTAPPRAAVKRVARGGYFDGLAESLRAAGRSRFQHDAVNVNVGFRCAKGIP